MNQLKTYIKGLIHLFFPHLCISCSNVLTHEEEELCYRCLSRLEPARYSDFEDNEIVQIFEGRVPIRYGTAGFKYHKEGILQRLIFQLKYHGHKKIGKILGAEMGFCLKNTEFQNIDYIIPVPLHPKRQRKRGYNQAEWIAKGLSLALNIRVNTDILHRQVHTSSQTKKNRIQRFENVQEIFKVMGKDEDIADKHILLTDDVITTGSTLEACANALISRFPSVKLSIACLAKAD